MITRIDRPTYHSSILDTSYDTHERAVEAEQIVEAESLRGPLFGIIWTRAAATAWNTLEKFNRRERQIYLALISNVALAQEKCRFATNQQIDQLIYDKSYHLDIILRMRNGVEDGPTLMSNFLQKFYPELYEAYFANTSLISPLSGLVGIYSKTVDDVVKYSTPIIHIEELLISAERYHRAFLSDYDIIVP